MSAPRPQSQCHNPHRLDHSSSSFSAFDESVEPRCPPSSLTHTKEKLKPYLRKRPPKDEKQIDLSLTAAENESVVGFGITNPDGRAIPDTTRNRRASHARSFSGASQLSTVSFALGTPLASAMRSGSRNPAPSHNQTFDNRDWVFVSDNSVVRADKAYSTKLQSYRPHSGSLYTTSADAPPLPMHSSASTPQLRSPSLTTLSTLQTNKTGRSCRNTISSLNTHSSRNSLEKTFAKLRGKGDAEPMTEEERVASIRAARQAWNEREEHKARKLEKKEARSRAKDGERALKSQEKEQWWRGAEGPKFHWGSVVDHKLATVRSSSTTSTEEKSKAGKAFDEPTAGHSDAPPTAVNGAGEEGGWPPTGPPKERGSSSRRREREMSRTKEARSFYMKIVAWVRTRLLGLSSRRR